MLLYVVLGKHLSNEADLSFDLKKEVVVLLLDEESLSLLENKEVIFKPVDDEQMWPPFSNLHSLLF